MIERKERTGTKFPHYFEIWDARFDPVMGTEIANARPALIISNDYSNEFTHRVTVLPLTSRPAKDNYPFEVQVPKGIGGLTSDSRILANQIRTFDKSRLIGYRGTLPQEYVPRVEKAVKIHLNMR
jgi:mRNA interferase MazF